MEHEGFPFLSWHCSFIFSRPVSLGLWLHKNLFYKGFQWFGKIISIEKGTKYNCSEFEYCLKSQKWRILKTCEEIFCGHFSDFHSGSFISGSRVSSSLISSVSWFQGRYPKISTFTPLPFRKPYFFLKEEIFPPRFCALSSYQMT